LSPHDKKTIKEMLIYEDDAILVFNKPSGLATQGGTKTHKHMDYYLAAFADKEGNSPKLVHRLDKETSGVLVVAKTRAVAERMGEIFKWREAKKTYLAITVDTPRDHEADIRHKLIKAGDKVIIDRDNGKDAHTYYKTLTFSGRDVALLALRPRTGRMHQLRVHLAHIKCPILGDKKYGGMAEGSYMEDAAQERMWLHALALSFPHPVTGKPLSFNAPVPHDMQKHLEEWHLDVEGVTDVKNPVDPLKNYNEDYA
jgi:23S rRNA pseudouridine955/2504/2580 synthase